MAALAGRELVSPVPVVLVDWPEGAEPVVTPPGVCAPAALPDLSLMVLLATSQHCPWDMAAPLEPLDPLGDMLDCAAAMETPPTSNAAAANAVSLVSLMIVPRWIVGKIANLCQRHQPSRVPKEYSRQLRPDREHAAMRQRETSTAATNPKLGVQFPVAFDPFSIGRVFRQILGDVGSRRLAMSDRRAGHSRLDPIR